jgi:cobalamin biosynthesis protein CobT
VGVGTVPVRERVATLQHRAKELAVSDTDTSPDENEEQDETPDEGEEQEQEQEQEQDEQAPEEDEEAADEGGEDEDGDDGDDEQEGCPVLNLDLGPLDLNLLGLRVELNRTLLDVTAEPGDNNLLGNLLCAVSGALDGVDLEEVLGGALEGVVDSVTGLIEGLGGGGDDDEDDDEDDEDDDASDEQEQDEEEETEEDADS